MQKHSKPAQFKAFKYFFKKSKYLLVCSNKNILRMTEHNDPLNLNDATLKTGESDAFVENLEKPKQCSYRCML
jgi:hypothetical protein